MLTKPLKKIIGLMLLFVVALGALPNPDAFPPHEKLSSYGFFTGNLSALSPAPGVKPYSVNAPLFSDYAEKSRFIYVPHGQMVQVHADSVFRFPQGSVLIKNFFFTQNGTRRLLETRLLLHEKKGWKGLTYVWNAEQTDATLAVAGETLKVTHPQERGTMDYFVPNLNQCKGCHAGADGRIEPIGLTSRQLNKEVVAENGMANQLSLLFGLSAEAIQRLPRLTDYTNPAQSLEARARAYLDGNCGYCHRPDGVASTSGLLLDIHQTSREALGVGKPPVAAGRGSGNRKYGIVPGKPDESILLYRMESDDPGIRMPEIGRSLAHREGIALIREWIKKMPE